MIQIFDLLPGVRLRCFRDFRFKHSCLSLQMMRPMASREAALNALLPSVLLRGTRVHPDIRSMTLHLDDLYGAAVGPMVRRLGDLQGTGFYASFTDDRFALSGDRILEPMTRLLRELLLDPLTDGNAFREDYVESEKKNLISAIESQRNNKAAWAMDQLLERMCREDSFGIPRLGEKEDVEAITHQSLYAHWETVLRESPVELFYVGSEDPQTVAQSVREIFEGIPRRPIALPEQTDYHWVEGVDEVKTMDVSQGKLCMGFTTDITCRHGDYSALRVFNTVFGGGMTSKLFSHIREKLSLCYAIGSSQVGTKGLITVSAGIDSNMDAVVREEILQQLELCRQGVITPEELISAKQELRRVLQGVHDSPGSIERYYSAGAAVGPDMTPEETIAEIEAVTAEDVRAVARRVQLHSVFFLKGVEA